MSNSFLKQPKSVWAVAFACVIAFMGIGLVDPILKPIAEQLHASPSQVSLLFTSYMAVIGVAMLITGAVSSRIGAKRTLLIGLAIIVVFSALAGLSNSIGMIVAFRAGWGLGNALFIATALATIVNSASGSVAQAIILYEAALGVGIAAGPLVGGELGTISWRGPFFGVAVLMTIALAATAFLLPASPPAPRRTSILEPLKALRHRSLATVAVTALLYNFGFFTLLAFTPFPLAMSARQIGLIFFGWGIGLALTSVFAAPRLQRRFGTLPVVMTSLLLFGADLAVMGIYAAPPAGPRDRRDRGRTVPRREQHADHRGRDGRRSGRARHRVRGVQLRPVLRWRGRSLAGRQARRRGQHPAAVLRRRLRRPARRRRPGHRLEAPVPPPYADRPLPGRGHCPHGRRRLSKWSTREPEKQFPGSRPAASLDRYDES